MSWIPLMLVAQTKAHIDLPTQASEAQHAQGRTFWSLADVLTLGFPFTSSSVTCNMMSCGQSCEYVCCKLPCSF